MIRSSRLIGLFALALAGACSGSSYTSTMGGGGSPGPDQVFMSGSAFTPTTRTVSVGTTVTWLNHDGFNHTVTSSSGPVSFNSGNVAGSGNFAQTFNTAGTYQYYCTLHGTPTTGMHATLIVQ